MLVPRQKFYTVTTIAATVADCFADQKDLYTAVDVFYTVAEEHVWQLSSAFPKIGYENVSLDFLRVRRSLDFGLDGVLQ